MPGLLMMKGVLIYAFIKILTYLDEKLFIVDSVKETIGITQPPTTSTTTTTTMRPRKTNMTLQNIYRRYHGGARRRIKDQPDQKKSIFIDKFGRVRQKDVYVKRNRSYKGRKGDKRQRYHRNTTR